MENLEAVLFDLDGTLYDYNKCHEKGLESAYEYMEGKYDIPYDKFIDLYRKARFENHKELVGSSSSHNRIHYFKRLLKLYNSKFKSDVVLDLYKAYYKGFFDGITTFKGVEELFEELVDKGISIGVVTNLNSRIQIEKIDKLGLSSFVDVFVTSEETSREKPHSSVFLLALHRLDVSEEEVLMVGDDFEKDVKGALSVGIDSVLLDKECEYGESSEQFEVVESINEVGELIEKVFSEN